MGLRDRRQLGPVARPQALQLGEIALVDPHGVVELRLQRATLALEAADLPVLPPDETGEAGDDDRQRAGDRKPDGGQARDHGAAPPAPALAPALAPAPAPASAAASALRW